jgi:hypothetical protein
MFSFQVSAPGSLAIWMPLCERACQMPKNAPPGSAAIAIRPTSMTSIGSIATWPPASLILRTVSSASAEAMYVVQAGGISAGPIFGPMPATGLPSSSAMEYPPDSGGPSWTSQPNRPV